MNEYNVAEALETVFDGLRACNKYIDETTPWALAKDPDKKVELGDVMANLIESIRLCNIMLTPFMPDAAEKINAIICADATEYCDGTFGYTYANTGRTLGDSPILFARIDEKKFLAEVEKERAEKEKAAKAKVKAEAKAASPKENVPVGIIGFDEFMKVELTVGKILSCEPVPKSEKLLKLCVNIGTEDRQIVSGIAKWYQPADLIGKKIVLCTNLKPAKLCGVESNGMILAADKNDAASVLFVDDSVPEGSRVH